MTFCYKHIKGMFLYVVSFYPLFSFFFRVFCIVYECCTNEWRNDRIESVGIWKWWKVKKEINVVIQLTNEWIAELRVFELFPENCGMWVSSYVFAGNFVLYVWMQCVPTQRKVFIRIVQVTDANYPSTIYLHPIQ